MTRCATLLAALLGIVLLAGCYRTELPLITRDNAHATAVLADGTYCEAVFRPADGGIAPLMTDTCIMLAWVPEERGWRTDASLGADDAGVSVRIRKLGMGSDAVGLSSVFLVQAGPTPRQATTGATVIPLASAWLMGGLVRDDMFVLIGTGATASQALERAQAQGIGLIASDDGFSVRSITGLSAANMAGAWMAGELARDIHAAGLPGAESDPGVIRIFVPRAGAGTTDGSPELLARMRLMLDAVLFEAGVFNQALGLGLAPPRIDLGVLDAPAGAPPSTSAATSQLQAIYDGLQFCKGMYRALEHHTLTLQTDVGFSMLAAARAGRDDLSAPLANIHEATGRLYELLADTVADLDLLLASLEARGADRTHGEQALGTGAAAMQLAPLRAELTAREAVDAMRDINEGFGQARDCVANVQQG